MSDSFDQQTLRLLNETQEVRVETRRNEDTPEHLTTIWAVTVDGDVFIRSVRGPEGRWYREAQANPNVALHAGDRRIAGRAVPATDEETVEKVSEAYQEKYEEDFPGPTRAMVRPEVLPTTLRVEPA